MFDRFSIIEISCFCLIGFNWIIWAQLSRFQHPCALGWDCMGLHQTTLCRRGASKLSFFGGSIVGLRPASLRCMHWCCFLELGEPCHQPQMETDSWVGPCLNCTLFDLPCPAWNCRMALLTTSRAVDIRFPKHQRARALLTAPPNANTPPKVSG